MNAFFRLAKSFCDKKTFALFLSFAILFANSAGAIGMVSMQHGAPESHSLKGMHAQMFAVADHTKDVTHLHGEAHAEKMRSDASSDSMDDTSCASICAAHCTNTVFYNSMPLTVRTVITKAAHLPSKNPHSAMVSGLYKPPRPLH